MSKVTINLPMNRVEGDLEVAIEIEDGTVTDAWASGTLYRGFERVLLGRGPLDGLVITPRVCGICSTSHLAAAAMALDAICGAAPPANAVRMRNVTLITEHLQSDLRQSFLTFSADFTNPAYAGNPLFAKAVHRYEPFRGETAVEVIRETKRVLEINMILGGQWPHSSYMVPGGVVFVPLPSDLMKCRQILTHFKQWYERRILGCSLERWRDVRSVADLDAWLLEDERHRQGDLGFFLAFARSLSLDKTGKGPGTFLSYGGLAIPEGSEVRAVSGNLIPPGFAAGFRPAPFEEPRVSEHVAYSWYIDSDGGKHPSAGETRPYASGHEAQKYSWAKAPRYGDHPAETGPLAEMVMLGDPLFLDLLSMHGVSTLVRQLARIVRPAYLIPASETWLTEAATDGPYYSPPGPVPDGSGSGLLQASRGALGHWVKIQDGRIDSYQIITPTTWNASPRDTAGLRGPLEEALVGLAVKDPENPVEAGHAVRSFDLCLVCTVHSINRGRKLGRLTLRF